MKTTFVTEESCREKILALVESLDCVSRLRPERFMRKMFENRGDAAAFSAFALDEEGLERRNPLIVALGDSVTAGHFEFVADPESDFGKKHPGPLTAEHMRELFESAKGSGTSGSVTTEIVDTRAAYPDRFREKLIDRYGFTSVSMVNSGIAGDTVLGMEHRLDRDVIRYQPDLILINASLNWFESCGSTEDYEKSFVNIVSRCLEETEADIILMTPNAALPYQFDNPACSLESRVEVIRNTAEKMNTCLADTYMVWKAYEAEGYPLKQLLTNGVNHPSAAGHEVFARVLMKLFDGAAVDRRAALFR